MRTNVPLLLSAALTIAAASVSACSSPSAPPPRVTNTNATSASPAQARATEVAAIIDGVPVLWSQILPRLAERGGAEALREVALDRAVEAEVSRRGLTIGPEAIEAERQRLADTLGEDAAALTERVLARRGLGPTRLAALLKRTAGLRALVARDAEVTDAEVALASRIRFGERRVVRVIVAPTPREAATLRQRASAGLDAFIEAAASGSTDASAARGGLLGPISADDPAFPEALRDAIARLDPGQVSPVVAVDDGFVVARVDAVEPARPATMPDAAIREELRGRKERIAMERTAETLMQRTEISVLDRGLGWAWDARGAR